MYYYQLFFGQRAVTLTSCKRCGGSWSPYCQAGVLPCAPWWSTTLTASRPTSSVWADKKTSGLAHNFAQHDLLDPGSLVQFFFYFGPSLAIKIFLFRYDTSDFYAGSVKGLEFKGPLWDPIRLLANLTTWSMFLVVPMFYCAIFKFRKAQNSTPGMMLSRQIHILMSDL